jgi:uncharacterized protein
MENVKAISVKTILTTENDEKRVSYFRDKLEFDLKTIFIDISLEEKILSNPVERCYFCKKKIFETLIQESHKFNIQNVLDGTTHSDLEEYRPGLKAIEELHILSPLKDAQITSGEIVDFLKNTGQIEDYYLTSSTCLATRFPYNFKLENDILRRFDKLESFLVKEGIFPVKIRFIPDGIRIEMAENLFLKIIKIKSGIINICKKNGIKFITLDLEGIKTGVWD